MSLSVPPFLRVLAFEVPGGGLPVFIHRRADGAERLERGCRLGLLDLLREFEIRAARFPFAAAEPGAERFVLDADVMARVGAIRADGEHGEDLLLDLRRKFRGPSARFLLGHVGEVDVVGRGAQRGRAEFMSRKKWLGENGAVAWDSREEVGFRKRQAATTMSQERRSATAMSQECRSATAVSQECLAAASAQFRTARPVAGSIMTWHFRITKISFEKSS
jgi:hypothetical protein